ncbi:MAG: lysylphosphatidylglycerol synthase domain-containing protein [Bacteroidales bacterium]|nr:lysylphosphatidylglycerol synthase domain-containing protein [Bacteroidales bacterium]
MKKSIIKNIMIFLFTALLIFSAFYFFVPLNELHRLKNISILYFILAILTVIIIFIISGVESYILFNRTMNIKIKPFDILTFPMTVYLWSYLIPVQGSTIYSTIFFYKKYNIKLSKSFSITLFTYIFTILFSGIAGLLYVIAYKLWSSPIMYISVFLLLSPFMVFIFYEIVKRMKFKGKLFINIHNFVLNTTSLLVDLNKNASILLIMLLIRLVSTVFFVIWYKCVSLALGYDVSSFGLLVLIFSLQIVSVLKITPGNLGISQIVSVVVMAAMGSTASMGPIITIIASFTAIIPAFTIGLYAHFRFLKESSFDFKTSKINDYFRSIKKS